MALDISNIAATLMDFNESYYITPPELRGGKKSPYDSGTSIFDTKPLNNDVTNKDLKIKLLIAILQKIKKDSTETVKTKTPETTTTTADPHAVPIGSTGAGVLLRREGEAPLLTRAEQTTTVEPRATVTRVVRSREVSTTDNDRAGATATTRTLTTPRRAATATTRLVAR